MRKDLGSVLCAFLVMGACGGKKDSDCTDPTRVSIKNQTDAALSVKLTSGESSVEFTDIAKSLTTAEKEITFTKLDGISLSVTSGTAKEGTVTIVKQQKNEIAVSADKDPVVTSKETCSTGGSGGGFW